METGPMAGWVGRTTCRSADYSGHLGWIRECFGNAIATVPRMRLGPLLSLVHRREGTNDHLGGCVCWTSEDNGRHVLNRTDVDSCRKAAQCPGSPVGGPATGRDQRSPRGLCLLDLGGQRQACAQSYRRGLLPKGSTVPRIAGWWPTSAI